MREVHGAPAPDHPELGVLALRHQALLGDLLGHRLPALPEPAEVPEVPEVPEVQRCVVLRSGVERQVATSACCCRPPCTCSCNTPRSLSRPPEAEVQRCRGTEVQR